MPDDLASLLPVNTYSPPINFHKVMCESQTHFENLMVIWEFYSAFGEEIVKMPKKFSIEELEAGLRY